MPTEVPVEQAVPQRETPAPPRTPSAEAPRPAAAHRAAPPRADTSRKRTGRATKAQTPTQKQPRRALGSPKRPRLADWSGRHRSVAIFLLACLVGTIIGVIALFPGSGPIETNSDFRDRSHLAIPTVGATVDSVSQGACGSPSVGQLFEGNPSEPQLVTSQCERALITLTSGPDAGATTLLEFTGIPGDPQLEAGKAIRLGVVTAADGTTRHVFQDYERGTAVLWWFIAAAAAVVLVGSWRGARSLIGIALTLVILFTFIIPALLQGQNPLAVAVIGGAAVLYLVLFLVHGFSFKTASALAGTLIALALAVGLSEVAIRSTHLTGLSDEDNHFILLFLPNVSVTGLLLAGFIIGALGVLNDVTISQAATVWELAELDADASAQRLFCRRDAGWP